MQELAPLRVQGGGACSAAGQCLVRAWSNRAAGFAAPSAAAVHIFSYQ